MYSQLSDARQIRLLELLPAETLEAPLECRLSPASLDANIDFSAISYCWGDPTDTRDVLVDGRRHAVTVSLCGALRRLRRDRVSRTLWADALCINQEDWKERSKQVKMMGDLFSNASRVDIWLGEEDEWTATAFSVLSAMAADSSGTTLRDHQSGKQLSPSTIFESLVHLFSRAWFERQWVVQEHYLARQGYFHCGPNVIESALLRRGALALVLQAHELRKGFRTLEQTQVLYQLLGHMNSSIGLWALSNMGQIEGRNCDVLFHATRNLLCRDPRDKIFSLMGMAPWLRSMDTDYSSTLEEVHRAATFATLVHQENLDLLAKISALYTSTSPRPGSSWALNFHEKHRPSTWSLHCASSSDCFDAAAGAPIVLRRRASEVLGLSGLKISSIHATGPTWVALTNDVAYATEDGEYIQMPQFNRIAQHRAKQLQGWQDFLNVSTDVLWDHMLIGVMPNRLRSETSYEYKDIRRLTAVDHEKLHGAFCGRSPESDRDLSKVFDEKMARTIDDAPNGSRPLKLWWGFSAVGPAYSRVGDVVFVLGGSTIPYVLRPSPCGRCDYYTLVGPAYVHNAMDGQFVRIASQLKNPESGGAKEVQELLTKHQGLEAKADEEEATFNEMRRLVDSGSPVFQDVYLV